MAYIIDRVFSGSSDRGISLGNSYGNSDGVISRQMAWGSNWKIIRMGITCAIKEFPSQSYDRNLGYVWGVSSGSRFMFNNVSDTTWVGVGTGMVQQLVGYGSIPMMFQNDISGSFFYNRSYIPMGYITGSVVSINAYTYDTAVYWTIANLGDAIQRRSLLMLEVSSSGNNYIITQCGMLSSSVTSRNSNKNYTSDDLKAILTSSILPPTASGVLMNSLSSTITYNSSSYPLDTVFFGFIGGIPFELYDWYIYKIR